MSACTCKGEVHPGPKRSDGTYVGRSAPEIDIFEATVSTDVVKTGQGQVSQSVQWAPMSHSYIWDNSTENEIVHDPTRTSFNPYTGGVYQMASSMLSTTDQNCYTQGSGCFSIYGMEVGKFLGGEICLFLIYSYFCFSIKVDMMDISAGSTTINCKPLSLVYPSAALDYFSWCAGRGHSKPLAWVRIRSSIFQPVPFHKSQWWVRFHPPITAVLLTLS